MGSVKKLLAAICLFLCFADANAQRNAFHFKQAPDFESSSKNAFVYLVPVDSVRKIVYEAGRLDPSVNWMQQPTHIVPVGKLDSLLTSGALAYGHYVTVKAIHSTIVFQIHHQSGFNVLSHDIDEIKILNVTDSGGRDIKDARVVVGNKTLMYDPGMAGYVISELKNAEVLSVSKGNDIRFYNCAVTENPKYEKPIQKNVATNTAAGMRFYNGYLVTNKPVYLPHDTVKWKAYLEDPYEKNKLVRERVRVSFADDWGRKQYESASKQKAEEPGVYFGEFVLGDSVKMDRIYKLDVYGTTSGLHIQTKFKTEDYLLDDTHLRVTGEEYDRFQPGDSVNLYAYAYNSNNLPVLDGELSITVLPNKNFRAAKEFTFIPDTLYRSVVPVNPDGETNLGFSTAAFSPVLTEFLCKVSLVNANNERVDTSFTINFAERSPYLRVKQTGRKVHAELILNKKSVAGKGGVVIHSFGIVPEQTIDFPYDHELRDNDRSLEFDLKDDSGKVIETLNFAVQKAVLSGVENFRGDTAILELSNPNKLFYRYSIYAGDNFRGYGYARGDTVIRVVSPKEKTVSLIGSYTWRGETHSQRFDIQKLDRELDIELLKKDLVYPGQKDTISVRLSNKDGKAVSRTNVTVLAFNSRFREDYTAMLPYGGLIYPGYVPRTTSSFNEKHRYSRESVTATKEWLRRCGADTMFFYKNLYLLPEQVAWVTYDIPASVQPQLSVTLKRKFYYFYPQIVYIDEQPVYVARAQGIDVRGFFVEEGKHELMIRTANAEYRIPEFEVCAGMKTDLYLDVDSVGPFTRIVTVNDTVRTYNVENHLRTFLSKQAMPGMLQAYEISLLTNHLLFYRPEGSINYDEMGYQEFGQPMFCQWPLQINAAKGVGTVSMNTTGFQTQSAVQLLGPFRRNEPIGFFQQGNTKRLFEAEPEFLYMFRPQLTRMEKRSMEGLLKATLYESAIWPGPAFVAPNPEHFDSMKLAAKTPVVQKEVTKPRREPQKATPAKAASRPVSNKVSTQVGVVNSKKLPVDSSTYVLRYSKEFASDSEKHAFIQLSQQDRYGLRYFILHRLDKPHQDYVFYGSQSYRIAAGIYQVIAIWEDDKYVTLDRVELKENGQTFIPIKHEQAQGRFDYAKAASWLKGYVVVVTPAYIEPGNGAIKGTLRDERGEPIINANVEIHREGIIVGRDITDLDGMYTVKPLEAGRYTVVFKYHSIERSYTGVPLSGDQTVTVNGKLNTSQSSAITVTVSRYVVPIIDPENPGGRSIKTADAIEKTPTRSTADIAELNTSVHQSSSPGLSLNGGRSGNTRYVIDGVQLNPGPGGFTNSAPGYVDAKQPKDKNLRGLMLDRKTDASQTFFNNFMSGMMSASGMRTSFRDWAIWEPNLWTGDDGTASFDVTYPDNITSWKTYVLAMNRDGYAGRILNLTRAFKPLSAELIVPRFLRYGDSAEGLGKVANYTQEPFRLRGSFTVGGKSISADTMTVHNSKVQKLAVTAPANNSLDTTQLPVTFSFTTDNGYVDGESRVLPVFPVGVADSKGDVFFLKSDTSIISKPDSASGRFTGNVHVRVDGSMLEVMLREVENLKEFPHGCNEQLTTKLLAIYYEEAIKKMMNRTDFNNTDTKKKILEQLVRNQHPDGSFTWWGDNGTADFRITNYILSTMQKVNEDGWLSYIISRGHSYLSKKLPVMSSSDRLTTLRTLTEGKYKGDFKPVLDHLDSLTNYSVNDRLLLIKIHRQQGLPYRIALDSVMKERSETSEGISWGYRNHDWYRDELATTLLAYSVVKGDSVYDKLIPEITRYILNKRSGGYYQSTAASGLVLTTLLPDLISQKSSGTAKRSTFVRLSGSIRDSITSFPKTFEARDSNASIRIEKEGFLPAYVSVVYDYFNTNPVASGSDFVVKTQFINPKTGSEIAVLKAGEKVTLRTTVTVKRQSEYIMIEVPIPAGCIQADKTTYYRYPEAAREHFKDQTDIFCAQLSPGTYTFDVTLEARFKGSYQVSPARAGLMYYPDAYGNTEVKRVEIR